MLIDNPKGPGTKLRLILNAYLTKLNNTKIRIDFEYIINNLFIIAENN